MDLLQFHSEYFILLQFVLKSKFSFNVFKFEFGFKHRLFTIPNFCAIVRKVFSYPCRNLNKKSEKINYKIYINENNVKIKFNLLFYFNFKIFLKCDRLLTSRQENIMKYLLKFRLSFCRK